MNDCLAVYEVNYTHLDFDYLKHWANELGVRDLLADIQGKAQI